MSQNEPKISELGSAIVVSMDDAARVVADHLAASYPAQQVEPAQLAAALLAQPVERSAFLPAVLVIAQTQSARLVLDALHEVRAADVSSRPRIWPVFIGGDVATLDVFDQALETAGGGLCDVVLLVHGASSASEQALALDAWIRLKMSAPASVLAELPDSQGQSCRYVALGAAEVDLGEHQKSAVPAIALVRATLASRLHALPEAEAARVTAGKFAEAGEIAAVSSLVAAEHAFNEQLVSLRSALGQQLPELIDAVLTAASAEGSESAAGPDAPAGPLGELAVAKVDHSARFSELLVAASKSGLGRVFGRSRRAAAAQAFAATVQSEVTHTVNGLIEATESTLRAKLDAEQRRLDGEVAAKVLAHRRQAVEQLRRSTKVWPRLNTQGIHRTWGGAIPAPRSYLVGGGEVVIDLRVGAAATIAENPEANDCPAVVLVAQYGLPLSALR